MGPAEFGKQRPLSLSGADCREPVWSANQASMPGGAKIGLAEPRAL